MARIRTIKPEFWQDEDLSELPADTHMLAASLLNHADDEGFFKANPKLVKAVCCPLREDSVSIHESLKQLEKTGYIELFVGTDGKKYGRIKKFTTHQKVNRPTPSKIKELMPVTEDSLKDHGGLTGGKEQGKEQGNTGESEDSRNGNRDYVWEKLLEVCDLSQDELTTSARGSCNKAVKALKEVSATPSDIEIRSKRYREIYPNATLTPAAMAKHWAQCRPETKKSPVADILEYAR